MHANDLGCNGWEAMNIICMHAHCVVIACDPIYGHCYNAHNPQMKGSEPEWPNPKK